MKSMRSVSGIVILDLGHQISTLWLGPRLLTCTGSLSARDSPFESVVLGSDHPSSCCTIMTRDISLLSTYLMILIPRIDCLSM